jgi:NhaP-type Na+/H+ or K+/H+ antiporter
VCGKFHLIAEPGSIGVGGAVLLFLEEMVGGAALGLAGGWVLAQSLKRLPIEAPLVPVLVLTGGLAVFGLAQLLGTSGFLATYPAVVIIGAAQHGARQDVEHSLESIAWLAQIVLFLMLGLLVTPEELPPFLPGAVIGAAVLIPLARRVSLSAAVWVQPARDGFRFLGRVARGGAELPQNHPRIGRSASRPPAVCQHVYPGDRLARRQRWTVAPAACLLGFGRSAAAPPANCR